MRILTREAVEQAVADVVARGNIENTMEQLAELQLMVLLDIRALLIDAAHPPITVYYPQSDAELDKVIKGFNAPRV